jgi:hypothetical protein
LPVTTSARKFIGAPVKEHLADQLIEHIARDATAILGNEKPVKKEKKEKAPKKRGTEPKHLKSL